MQLFSNYIQPLIDWLQLHPHWALCITFIISFTESLALIGSIIPGSVTMTAIGILAGSGVMRVDLTLIAAILGAVAGDSLSYLIGFIYSKQLPGLWPFKKYPQWIAYGNDYFTSHGGKSVLIGRFIGPLRSIIPVIAGMLHMNQWRFLAANIASAILWSILYVVPGVAIGAASNELSPEIAAQLFTFILVFLGVLWLLTLTLRWILKYLNIFFHNYLHEKWVFLKNHSRIRSFIQYITPIYEENHSKTMGLTLLSGIAITSFIILTLLTCLNYLQDIINQPAYLFLQSIRINVFDVLLIIAQEIINPITLVTIGLSVLIICIYKKDWRSALYWISLHLACACVLLLFYFLAQLPQPNIPLSSTKNAYPAGSLLFATAQFSFLLLYSNFMIKNSVSRTLNILFLLILLIASFSLVYLGDKWVTDTVGGLLVGLSISLIHWIGYRRQLLPLYSSYLAWVLILFMAVASSISIGLNFEKIYKEHQIYLAQYVFDEKFWWSQVEPILPIYRINRIGKPANVFNIQYAGSLSHLESALTTYGWKKKNETFLTSFVKRINGQHTAQDSPLIAQLYLNRKPALIMMLTQSKDKNQILRLWRSNFHLKHYHEPIWLGTVNPVSIKNQLITANNPSLQYITAALPEFKQKKITLPIVIKSQKPFLLLIKQPYRLLSNKNHVAP